MKDTTILWIGAGLVVLALLMPGLLGSVSGSGFGPWGMGPGMMGGGPWPAGQAGSTLTPLLLLGGVALIVYWAARNRGKGGESLEVLKQRLVRGEITREQFDELKRILEG